MKTIHGLWFISDFGYNSRVVVHFVYIVVCSCFNFHDMLLFMLAFIPSSWIATLCVRAISCKHVDVRCWFTVALFSVCYVFIRIRTGTVTSFVRVNVLLIFS